MTDNVNRDDEIKEMFAAENPVGAEVLDDVAAWFTRFIAFTDPDDALLLTLWTAHTYLALELYTSPRLMIDSTVPESGKTTVLEHLDHLAFNPIQAAAVTSSALIPRLLEAGPATILIDEVDRTLRPDKPTTPDLLAILNSGYKVGGKRPVLVQTKGGDWEPRAMSTFAPVAMAGNAPKLPDDTKSRSIRVLLMPDLEGETDDSDWEFIEAEAQMLRDGLQRWADSVRDSIKGAAVDLPPGCTRRSRERWRPLKRVATAAGGRWPEVADKLIVKGLAEDSALREAGLQAMPLSMVLLTDLYSTWPDDSAFMSTRDLVARLIAENPEYWSEKSSYGKDLTDTRFGRLLAQASKLTSCRPAHDGPRGFTRAQLEPVWKRLGIPPRMNLAQPGQPGRPGPETGNRAGSAGSARLGQVETDPPRPGWEPGRFAYPPCFHCDKPVTTDAKDNAGRYAHLSCQQEQQR